MAASMADHLLGRTATGKIRLAIVFYAILGVAFVIALTLTMVRYPLYPFKLDSADWASAWLITTIGDYGVATLCLCGVVLSTETGFAGLAWSFAMLFLGSVFSCAYMIYRSVLHESISLGGRNAGLMKMPAVVAFSILGLAFGTLFTMTMKSYPLVPFLLEDAAWSSAWLLTTIADYYAQSFCLCAIILATEDVKSAVAWSCGILILGSGFACAYMIYRCWQHGTLALTSNRVVT